MSHIKKSLIEVIESAPEINPKTAVTIALKLKGSSVPQVAKREGFNRKTADNVLAGRANSKKIKEVFVKEIGFDPWENK